MASTRKLVIYSSASGGTFVQKKTTEMVNMVRAIAGKEPQIVFLDAEPAERQTVWQKSGKKGVYPLLFVDDEFIGDVCIVLSLLRASLFVLLLIFKKKNITTTTTHSRLMETVRPSRGP